MVCLAGPSGSGKSLFLRAIADLVINEGLVELDGVERSRIEPTAWRRQVGYLPAEVLWWEPRVREHFLTAPSADQLERFRLPVDCLGWDPSRLSTGERQRLGILRLLDRSPAMLLLDEPTANLDDENTSLVEGAILEYASSRRAGVLWVSHDSMQARRVGHRMFRFEGKAMKAVESGGSS